MTRRRSELTLEEKAKDEEAAARVHDQYVVVWSRWRVACASGHAIISGSFDINGCTSTLDWLTHEVGVVGLT